DFVAKRVVQEQVIILHAGHGAEALDFAFVENPDLIILDIQMPGMDGLEVLARLKENEKTAKIPVLMLSSMDDPENIKKSIELGAAVFLVKANETPASIVEKIRITLAKSGESHSAHK
ncbi:MAG: response regulator, partial [Methylococcaceae bacterium]